MARAVLARPSLSRAISTSAGTGGDGQQGVIAPLAGVAVVAGPLLGQTVAVVAGPLLGQTVAVVAGPLLGQTVAILCPCPACAEATN